MRTEDYAGTEVGVDYALSKMAGETPETEEAGDLYPAAASRAPLNEASRSAQVSSAPVATALERNELVPVSAIQQGQLMEIAYGHRWRWGEQCGEWGEGLKSRYGGKTAFIDKAVALFRTFNIQHRDLRRRAPMKWLDAVEHELVWLQTTDVDTLAQRLY